MYHYKVLDLDLLLKNYPTIMTDMTSLRSIEISLEADIDSLHQNMMSLNLDQLNRYADFVRDLLSRFTCGEMKNLIAGIFKALNEQNSKKLISLYVTFLEECIILYEEISDYSETQVRNRNLQKYIKETKETFWYHFETKELEEAKKDSPYSCPGCNIF